VIQVPAFPLVPVHVLALFPIPVLALVLALTLTLAPALECTLAHALALDVVALVLALVSLVVMTLVPYLSMLSSEEGQTTSFLTANSKALLSLLLVDLVFLAAHSIHASGNPVHPHQVAGSAPVVVLVPELVLRPELELQSEQVL